jgi:choline dehydrogenase-like flavoprotein
VARPFRSQGLNYPRPARKSSLSNQEDPTTRRPSRKHLVLQCRRTARLPRAVNRSPRLNNLKFNMALGHVLSGGTSINAMVWMRGMQRDYDGWAEKLCLAILRPWRLCLFILTRTLPAEKADCTGSRDFQSSLPIDGHAIHCPASCAKVDSVTPSWLALPVLILAARLMSS